MNNQQTVNDAVTWICSNQDLVKAILIWALGVMPGASALTWFNAKYKMLPPGAQTILHLIGGNLVHAIMNDPSPPPPPPPPPANPNP